MINNNSNGLIFVNDRLINLFIANSRNTKVLQESPMYLSNFYQRLSNSQSLPWNHADYMQLTKPKQDRAKDIGAYIAGVLKDGRRKSGAITSRSALAIDIEGPKVPLPDMVTCRISALGISYALHSTAKHGPGNTRLRLIIPLASDIETDKFSPVTRLICRLVDANMEWFDPTCAEPNRLMFWASHCQDVQPVFYYEDKPLLDAEALLERDLPDWRAITTWPRFAGEQEQHGRNIAKAIKQGDPEGKTGVVGAFCRIYNIHRAMDELIPGVYQPVDNSEDRYTFTEGSTAGGAVLYEGGKFLYSHHATDPCSGKLVNAFDLVRGHKFGHLDDAAEDGARGNRLPSYLEMYKYALSLPEVTAQLDHERYISAVADFADVTVIPSGAWMASLKRNESGVYDKSAQNVQIMLESDPRFINKIGFDDFSHRTSVLGPLPWNTEYPRPWTDADRAFLQIEVEKLLKFSAPQKIDTAFMACAATRVFHPVREYLKGLVWDGLPRLDTLYIDYLGAADTPYTRAVTRKGYVAAVARVMIPGCKFDTMTILTGPQGGFKSTLIRYMSGDAWFNDSIKVLSGKDAMEALRGTWFVEFAELEAFNKADVTLIKSYLSSVMDRFRVSYGHFIQDFPRQCVFFGTSNKLEVLRDSTGGRRFWVVQTDIQQRTKNVIRDLLGERDQLWAEAFMYWRAGEEIFLKDELLEQAAIIQEAHRETDPWESIIQEFVDEPIPTDWENRTLDDRLMFWCCHGTDLGTEPIKLKPRDRICAIEVWCEALRKNKADIQRRDSVRINAILAALPGWEKISYPDKFPPYGGQRGFRRRSW